MRTVIAIALGAALGAGGFALAQHEKHGDAAKVKSLLVQDVSEEIDGKEARVSVLEVSYGPGASPRRTATPARSSGTCWRESSRPSSKASRCGS